VPALATGASIAALTIGGVAAAMTASAFSPTETAGSRGEDAGGPFWHANDLDGRTLVPSSASDSAGTPVHVPEPAGLAPLLVGLLALVLLLRRAGWRRAPERLSLSASESAGRRS
jgi:hypothetical protein